MLRNLWFLPALLLAALLIGCSGSNPTTDVFTIDITARIDGIDNVSLQGDTLTWNHIDYSMPTNVVVSTATSDGCGIDKAPVMTDVPWDVTSPLTITPPAPNGNYQVTLEIIQYRDSLTITQYPDAGNNFTTIVSFNDGTSGGATTYQARLTIDPE